MRIILADHHPQALWALKTTLQERQEFTIIGDAEDTEGLLALALADTPDLVLVDSDLPGEPMEDLISELHLCKPRPAVVVMSSKLDYGRMMLKAGADAFVSKGDQPDWLLLTLKRFEQRLQMKRR
jgi:DNA-binding NarL/FixJ family response regulator